MILFLKFIMNGFNYGRNVTEVGIVIFILHFFNKYII